MYEILQSEISQIFKVFFLEKLRVAEDMSRKHKISEVIFRIALFLITIAATIFSYIIPTINPKATKKDSNFVRVGGLNAMFIYYLLLVFYL
jgi:hypothetical protein